MFMSIAMSVTISIATNIIMYNYYISCCLKKLPFTLSAQAGGRPV
jgi:hypothetical protein